MNQDSGSGVTTSITILSIVNTADNISVVLIPRRRDSIPGPRSFSDQFFVVHLKKYETWFGDHFTNNPSSICLIDISSFGESIPGGNKKFKG